MQTYRFLGTEATIGGANPAFVNRFGQSVQIPDVNLADALRSSVLVLPEDKFAAFGWSETDLAQHFSIPLLHEVGTPEIKARWKATWAAAVEFRESVLNPPKIQGEPYTPPPGTPHLIDADGPGVVGQGR